MQNNQFDVLNYKEINDEKLREHIDRVGMVFYSPNPPRN